MPTTKCGVTFRLSRRNAGQEEQIKYRGPLWTLAVQCLCLGLLSFAQDHRQKEDWQSANCTATVLFTPRCKLEASYKIVIGS